MVLSLCFQIRLMRFFWRIKTALANALAVGHYLHNPFSLVLGNTKKSGLVGFGRAAHILQISKTINFTQICKAVVFFVPVYVINVFRRPNSSNVKPSQPMCQPFLIVDSNSPIPRISWAARTLAYKIGPAAMRFPSKLARLWVVVQHRSDMFNCSHDSQFTIGAAK
jgi:hypothetical protein